MPLGAILKDARFGDVQPESHSLPLCHALGPVVALEEVRQVLGGYYGAISSSAAARTDSSCLPASTTDVPASEKSFAVAGAMPEPAPVTSPT